MDREDSLPAFARPPSYENEETDDTTTTTATTTTLPPESSRESADLIEFSVTNSEGIASSNDLLGFGGEEDGYAHPSQQESEDIMPPLSSSQDDETDLLGWGNATESGATVTPPAATTMSFDIFDAPPAELETAAASNVPFEPTLQQQSLSSSPASPLLLDTANTSVESNDLFFSPMNHVEAEESPSMFLSDLQEETNVAAVEETLPEVFEDDKPAQETVVQVLPSTTERTGPATDATTSQQQQEENDALKAALERVEFLEMELAKTKAKVDTIQVEDMHQGEETAELMMELQSSLQQQMSLKAEAENKARLVEAKIAELEETNEKQQKELSEMNELRGRWEEQMQARAEAENKARQALEQAHEMEQKLSEQASEIEKLQRQVVEAREAKAAQDDEVRRIREERDEQRRKEIALTNRLNEAKKKEGVQSNLAEQYEDEIKALEQELESFKKELSETKTVKIQIEEEFEKYKTTAEERAQHAETALVDERALNEERKRKMKGFIESKAEELRQAKEDNENLQNELAQVNRSLVDLNNRWKQLHAQWVQSQTRNRELQRDLNRTKKDSENLHKVGDSLEMKLSRSANETEEHKNKRLAAKHELMTVLRTLEMERQITAKLKDSIKFTFTPKALSQQQLLNNDLEELEAQLRKLSLRLNRPLPPSSAGASAVLSEESERSESENGDTGGDLMNGDDDVAAQFSRSDADAQRLISKLESETQRVSRSIMAISNSIERLHLLLDGSGDRSCYTVLTELLTTGTITSSPAIASSEETTSITGGSSQGRFSNVRSHRYGQVPPSGD